MQLRDGSMAKAKLLFKEMCAKNYYYLFSYKYSNLGLFNVCLPCHVNHFRCLT